MGTISISAWQLEDRAEQMMSLSLAPESAGGRVRDRGVGAWRRGSLKPHVLPVSADGASC